MADDRSVLKPAAPLKPAPHPPMAQLYTDTDDPVPYMDLPALAASVIQTGSVIDDELNGYRRSVMVVQIECDAASAGSLLYLHILPTLDGINYSDATVNTAEADVYLPEGAGRVVLWQVSAPPTPFRMAIEATADLGAVGVSYAFYGTVDVPV